MSDRSADEMCAEGFKQEGKVDDMEKRERREKSKYGKSVTHTTQRTSLHSPIVRRERGGRLSGASYETGLGSDRERALIFLGQVS